MVSKMSYSVTIIANFFIKKYKEEFNKLEEKAKLDQIKLMKLVYIAHGWYLATYDKPLINEPIEAWRHGPVIASLWQSIRCHGMGAIINPIEEIKIINDDGFIIERPNPDDIDTNTKEFLEGIWGIYKNESGIKLSNWTHLKGSPWYKAWELEDGKNNKNHPISNQEIKEYFKGLLNDAI